MKVLVNFLQKTLPSFNYSIQGIRRLSHQMQTMEKSITEKLNTNFQPEYLEIINESYMHNVPKGSETHFKVVVISQIFQDLPIIKRHRLINESLATELNSGVHALSITAKTPEQWKSCGGAISKSPPCRGGAGL